MNGFDSHRVKRRKHESRFIWNQTFSNKSGKMTRNVSLFVNTFLYLLRENLSSVCELCREHCESLTQLTTQIQPEHNVLCFWRWTKHRALLKMESSSESNRYCCSSLLFLRVYTALFPILTLSNSEHLTDVSV